MGGLRPEGAPWLTRATPGFAPSAMKKKRDYDGEYSVPLEVCCSPCLCFFRCFYLHMLCCPLINTLKTISSAFAYCSAYRPAYPRYRSLSQVAFGGGGLAAAAARS